MSGRDDLAAYARLAAASLPLACAKRLHFSHADDCRAVLADAALYALASTPTRIFELIAEALTVRARPVPQHAGREQEEAYQKREWARVYREIVPLVPVPTDTKWEIRKDGTHVRMRGGYTLTMERVAAVKARRYGFGGTPAHWRIRATAEGLPYTEPFRPAKGDTTAAMRKQLDAWADAHPIVAARLAHGEASK